MNSALPPVPPVRSTNFANLPPIPKAAGEIAQSVLVQPERNAALPVEVKKPAGTPRWVKIFLLVFFGVPFLIGLLGAIGKAVFK